MTIRIHLHGSRTVHAIVRPPSIPKVATLTKDIANAGANAA